MYLRHNAVNLRHNHIHISPNYLNNMAQTSMTVRLDKKQKAIFDELCAQFGMSANTAINILTSSLRHPKILIKEFSYFLMPCHQHGLRINLLV